MEKKIVAPGAIFLPPGVQERRRPPRPEKQRQPDYSAKFDYDTLLYDVFLCDGVICGIGPPQLNLKRAVRKLDVHRGGIACKWQVRDVSRVSRWRLRRRLIDQFIGAIWTSKAAPAFSDSQPLTIKFGSAAETTAVVGEDFAHLFCGKRCLLTKSKNNNLQWIRDWVSYHVKWHGADAVLFYDNGSNEYSSEQILESIAVAGIAVAVVVEWPFKWGLPSYKGSRGDSDFAQYGALEHARWRFLRDAASVANLDIDELLVGDRSVFEIAEAAPEGAVQFDGWWVDNVLRGAGELSCMDVRHGHFGFVDPYLGRCAPKWCAVPRKTSRACQWRVHSVSPCSFTDEVQMRHFLGITTNWKYERPSNAYDPARHVEDEYLAARIRIDI